MKIFNLNYKIQLKAKQSPWAFEWSDYKEVFFRINPSQLTLFERIFNNPWRKLYHACEDIHDVSLNPCYTAKNFHTLKESLKTFKDVIDYQVSQINHVKDVYEVKVKNNEIWPDKKIEGLDEINNVFKYFCNI